jgi:hypothetical protein
MEILKFCGFVVEGRDFLTGIIEKIFFKKARESYYD